MSKVIVAFEGGETKEFASRDEAWTAIANFLSANSPKIEAWEDDGLGNEHILVVRTTVELLG